MTLKSKSFIKSRKNRVEKKLSKKTKSKTKYAKKSSKKGGAHMNEMYFGHSPSSTYDLEPNKTGQCDRPTNSTWTCLRNKI